jgi:5-methyltetrahydrofolate--homocysteine methyltransferase
VGRLDRDQVEDYAARKGVSTAQAERWLRPNLGYEPAEDEDDVRVATASSGT